MRPGSAARRSLRRALLVVIAALYVASVPWYREGGSEPAVWLGLPDWVAVALGCYVAAALLNALAWWISDIDDATGDDAGAGGDR